MPKANLLTRAERWQANGSAELTLSDYQPFLRVRDIASLGRSHRITSWTVGRIHHLFSDLESFVFFFFDYMRSVTDIREQYPLLPLTATLEIADSLGIKHPFFKGKPHVMTTDFLITRSDGCLFAIQVKPSSELELKRVNEKLEIEKEYWRRKKIVFKVVTEKEIPLAMIAAVRWIHKFYDCDGILKNRMRLDEYCERFIPWLKNNQELNLSKACLEADDYFGMETGKSLLVVRYLLARRMIPVSIRNGINTLRPLAWIDGEIK